MPAGSAAVVRANSEAFSRRDVEAMLELFAPDAVVRDRRAVGWGDFLGRDAIRAYYEWLFDNAEEIFQSGAKTSSAEHEALQAQLYEQIGRLKTELDWLKKKAASFG